MFSVSNSALIQKMIANPLRISQIADSKVAKDLDLLGEELDKRVQRYIIALRHKGAVINTSIVLACAEGLIKIMTVIYWH